MKTTVTFDSCDFLQPGDKVSAQVTRHYRVTATMGTLVTITPWRWWHTAWDRTKTVMRELRRIAWWHY